MARFGRTYEIIIQNPQGDQILISPPFTAEFRVVRNTLASANTCDLTIVNLSRATRERLFKDRYSITEYWQMRIRAGYERLETVFLGNIYEAFSFKQNTEWMTKLTGFDGMYGIQNGFTARTIQGGTEKESIVTDLISDIPNVVAGVLGSPAQGSSGRGKVLFGQSSKVLSEEVDGQYFIDNETVNVMSRDEIDSRQVVVVDRLYQTPRRSEATIEAETIFLPGAKIGTYAELRSVEEIYNGQYKIQGFTHSVKISQADSGSATTTLNLYKGAEGLQEVA